LQTGLVNAIMASLRTLSAQIDPEQLARNETPPLLEVALELAAPDLVWQPEIGTSPSGTGVRDMFEGWIAGFLHIGKLVMRVDGAGGTYTPELEANLTIVEAVERLRKQVTDNEAACATFRNGYAGFDHLWMLDMNETLQSFLIDQGLEGGLDPPLECFDGEIGRYKAAQSEVASLNTGVVMGWLRIDARPIKQALSTWVTKWVFLYTHYLFDKVVTSMQEMYDFIGKATKSLEKDPGAEQDAPAKQAMLYEVMGTMRDIRKRTDRTEALFDPLRATVTLLKGYGIALEETTLTQLEEGPIAWGTIRKRMLNVREKLTDLQQDEARVIRERSDAFTARVEAFRAAFLKLAPFAVAGAAIKLDDVAPAYETLDAFRHGSTSAKFSCGSVSSVSAEGRALNEAQELFEIFVSDYATLRRCDEDLNALKGLWDMIAAIMFTLTEWNKTYWDKIDVDTLVEETKKITKCVASAAGTRCACACFALRRALLTARHCTPVGRSRRCPRACACSRRTASWRSRSKRCSPRCRWCPTCTTRRCATATGASS
jgi:dynein heavy chain